MYLEYRGTSVGIAGMGGEIDDGVFFFIVRKL